MKVYTLIDYTNSKSIHLAKDFDSAVQAHLVHYGLLSLDGWLREIDVKDLKDIQDRSVICWDLQCVLAGASAYESNKRD